ncbi:MAG: hypothetical protein HC793_01510 [Aquincola sp.]|nr:hypothetical protein [Aquincola sp.]
MSDAMNAGATPGMRVTGWLRCHARGLLLLVLILGCAGAVAQVVGPTPAPSYCYGTPFGIQSCHATLDQADAALRSSAYLQAPAMSPSTSPAGR